MFDPENARIALAATAMVSAAGACGAGAASALAHAELQRTKRAIGAALDRAFGPPDPVLPPDMAGMLQALNEADAPGGTVAKAGIGQGEARP